MAASAASINIAPPPGLASPRSAARADFDNPDCDEQLDINDGDDDGSGNNHDACGRDGRYGQNVPVNVLLTSETYPFTFCSASRYGDDGGAHDVDACNRICSDMSINSFFLELPERTQRLIASQKEL